MDVRSPGVLSHSYSRLALFAAQKSMPAHLENAIRETRAEKPQLKILNYNKRHLCGNEKIVDYVDQKNLA